MRQWDITAKKCMKMRNLLFVVALGLITTLNLSAEVKKDVSFNDLMDSKVAIFIDGMPIYPEKIYGDLQLDSVVETTDDGYSTYIFNSKGQLTTRKNESLQIHYKYNAEGQNYESVAQEMNTSTGEWYDTWKAEFTRDAQGRITRSIYSELVSGTWHPKTKGEYEYNAQGEETFITRYEYKDNLKAWQVITMYKYEITYNEQGKQTEWIYSNWEHERGWKNNAKNEYEYDAKGRETLHLVSSWDSSKSSWKTFVKYTSGYSDLDDGMTYQLKLEQHWSSNSNSWENYAWEAFTYDANGNEIKYSLMYASEGKITFERTSTYNSAGRLISVQRDFKDGTIYTAVYSYDDYGNLAAIDAQDNYSINWYFSTPQGIESGIESVTDRTQVMPIRKVLRNGQLLIYRGEDVFTVNGALAE